MRQTRACWLCGEPAVRWTGHVHQVGPGIFDAIPVKVHAGWCAEHAELRQRGDSSILPAIADAFPGRVAIREALKKNAYAGCQGCYGDISGSVLTEPSLLERVIP